MNAHKTDIYQWIIWIIQNRGNFWYIKFLKIQSWSKISSGSSASTSFLADVKSWCKLCSQTEIHPRGPVEHGVASQQNDDVLQMCKTKQHLGNKARALSRIDVKVVHVLHLLSSSKQKIAGVMESRSATCVFRVGIPAGSRQNETESRTCSKLFDTGSMSSHPHFKGAIMLGYEMDIQ